MITAMFVVLFNLLLFQYTLSMHPQLLNKYQHETKISRWLCHTMGNQELLCSAVVLSVDNFCAADMLHHLILHPLFGYSYLAKK